LIYTGLTALYRAPQNNGKHIGASASPLLSPLVTVWRTVMKMYPTFLSGCLLAFSLTATLPRLAHADPATTAGRPPLPFLLAAAPAAQGPMADLPPPQRHPPEAMGLPPFGDMPLPPILHGIKLSEAQQDRVFALLHELAPRLREQAKIVRHSGEALRALALAPSFDEAQARALAQSEAKARAELGLLIARSDSQLLALLTPEQRQQRVAMPERCEGAGHDNHQRHEPQQGWPFGAPQGGRG
jgi:Spy/CpxP family protein refolding chaperone